MSMQYGSIAQNDPVAGPFKFQLFILSANEPKIISLSIEGLGTATCHNQT